MKVTLDTNFLISATQWDNSVAFKLFKKLVEINSQIFITQEILDEFKEVLEREFKYSNEEITKIIRVILAFSILIISTEKINIVKDDPDDNKIIECALSSNSDYIITYDHHLLKLGNYDTIKILRPEELLKVI